MMMLCLLAMISLSAFSAVSDAGIIRVERDACVEVHKKFETCTSQAYEDYKAAHEAGDDGRPDWLARKSCNYMTAAVEDCGNMLIGVCNTEDEVTKLKDQQQKGILAQLSSSIAEWDSEKCPAVKTHVDRMKGEQTEAEDDACVEIHNKYETCTSQAYEVYKAAHEVGDDGRPDCLARKSCNYMTAAVEDCGSMIIGVCNTEDEVTEQKDQQLKGILAQLSPSIAEWDSEKCPAVKAHIDRTKAEKTEVEHVAEKEYTCDEVVVRFNSCTMQAYEDYKAANEAGEDGRPDWLARKSCNYMTAGVEDCGNMLIGVCNTKEDVTASKDSQLKSILAQLQTAVDKWDSEKCPAVKAHIDRMKCDEDRNLAWILEKIYQLFGGLVTFISSL